ncbi:MAG: response regulator [Myxococcota bacterium]
MDPRPIQDLLTELGVKNPTCTSVLLVDDEFEVLAVLEALLDDEWDVYTAQGGREALEILNSDTQIDVVITDQRMPEMTGVELLSILADTRPDLYRIVLTAYSDVDPIVAAINQGKVDRFVLKPWDPEGLRVQVAEGLAVCARRAAMRSVVSTLATRHEEKNSTLKHLRGTEERAQANERLSVLGWMTSGLGEELSNLLGNLSDLLNRPTEDDSTRQAKDAVVRVRSLLDDMQRLSTNGDEHIQREPVVPRKLISEAVRLLLHDELGDNNPVHVDIDPSIELLHVDPDHVRQALLNLLRNASRASPANAPIQVKVRREGSHMIVIEVIDQGEGMSTQVLQQATQPFFSAFEPPGNGLGLSVCRLVAKSHGGRLSILDNEPSGVLAQLWLQAGPS